MLRKSLIGLLSLVGVSSFAQQDAQYTQYMYNMVNVNPAYAGNRGVLSMFGLFRQQWAGIEGAPQTGNLTVHTPIANTKLGLGLSLANDRIGAINDNRISADISYTIDLNDDNSKLSFGLKGTANLFNVDYAILDVKDQDPVLVDDTSLKFSPNIGAGVYWHNTKSYIGFSVPNFIENNRFDTNSIYKNMNAVNHYYLTAGHVFDLNKDVKLKPAVLLKAVPGTPLQADFSANFLLKEKLTLGAAYRMNAAWSVMAGYQINDSFLMGYAFDAATSELFDYNFGSHELFLRYELFKRYKKINTPRFF